MRVLVVSQFYSPEPVPIPGEVADELSARGHSVRVVTGFPNYPDGRVREGYSQRWRRHERNGRVEILRVPLFADHSQSAVRRLLNYVSFALSASTTLRFARDIDVVYVYATPMTAAFPAWVWRFLRGAPYVIHVQDLWPDSVLGSSMMVSGRNVSAATSILSAWLESVYSRAAAVVGIAPTMVSELVSRGAASDKTHLVYNWADATESVRRPVRRDRSSTKILYAGNVGDMQDLETVIRAAHAAADAGIELTILGDGVAKGRLLRLSEELGTANVSFMPSIPRERMKDVYAITDFAIVSLKDLPAFRGTIPSKFQAVLAAGVPVIATVQGDVRSFVEESGVGLTADSEDAGDLESAFRTAAGMGREQIVGMSQRARRGYEDTFSRGSGMTKLERILMEVTVSTNGDR